jgi:hypothetical protein
VGNQEPAERRFFAWDSPGASAPGLKQGMDFVLGSKSNLFELMYLPWG